MTDALQREIKERIRVEAHEEASERVIAVCRAMIEEERKNRLQAIADWRAEKKRAEAAEAAEKDAAALAFKARDAQVVAEKSLEEFRRKWGHVERCFCHRRDCEG